MLINSLICFNTIDFYTLSILMTTEQFLLIIVNTILFF